jgi:hypothetical protein
VTGLRLGRASGPESELATFLRWRPTGATDVTQHRAGSQNRDPGQVQAVSKTKRHSEPTRPDPKGTGETASEHHRGGGFLIRGSPSGWTVIWAVATIIYPVLKIEFLAPFGHCGTPPAAYKLGLLQGFYGILKCPFVRVVKAGV